MSFPDVVGQPHVVQTLVHAVEEQRVAHAYLFSGMRGVGKTTVARILAKALNCQQGLPPTPCTECQNCIEIANGQSFDVVEIDGASNRGIDDVRNLRETVRIGPTKGARRIYIIDEVHMLTPEAFNALLKTLEEPPAHVIFIFATTEVRKIPQTVLSRCQHFSFRRVPLRLITDRLHHIVTQEGIAVSSRGLDTIARSADGSLRDALSLLDQIVAFAGRVVEDHHIDTVLGNVPYALRQEMLHAVVTRDPARALEVAWAVGDQGGDFHRFLRDLVEDVRSLIVLKITPRSLERLDIFEGLQHQGEEAIRALTIDSLQEIFEILAQAQDRLKYTEFPLYVLEMVAIKICQLVTPQDIKSVSPVDMANDAHDHADTAHAERALKMNRTKTQEQTTRMQNPLRATRAMSRASDGSDVPLAPDSMTSAVRTVARKTPQSPVTIDWAELVAKIGVEKPNLAAYLEEGVPIKHEDGVLMIAFSENRDLCRERMARAENRQYVQAACRSLCGTSVDLKFVRLANSSEPVKTIGMLCQESRAERTKSLYDQTLAHPSVRMVLDEFGGQLQAVREDHARGGEPQ